MADCARLITSSGLIASLLANGMSTSRSISDAAAPRMTRVEYGNRRRCFGRGSVITRSASILSMTLAPIARSPPAFRLLRYCQDHEDRSPHEQAQGISDTTAQTARLPRALLCRNGKHRLVLKCGGYDVLDPADPSVIFLRWRT